MGEGTPHVAGASARVGALGAEATAARERLDVLVVELRRRRDELMDWRTQLRKHRRGLTIVLGGVVALAGAGLAQVRVGVLEGLQREVLELEIRGDGADVVGVVGRGLRRVDLAEQLLA